LMKDSAHEMTDIALWLTMRKWKYFNECLSSSGGLNEWSHDHSLIPRIQVLNWNRHLIWDDSQRRNLWFDLIFQSEMWHWKQTFHQTRRNSGGFHNVHIIYVIGDNTYYKNGQRMKWIGSREWWIVQSNPNVTRITSQIGWSLLKNWSSRYLVTSLYIFGVENRCRSDWNLPSFQKWNSGGCERSSMNRNIIQKACLSQFSMYRSTVPKRLTVTETLQEVPKRILNTWRCRSLKFLIQYFRATVGKDHLIRRWISSQTVTCIDTQKWPKVSRLCSRGSFYPKKRLCVTSSLDSYPAFGKNMCPWMVNCHVDGVLTGMLSIYFWYIWK
jgi:hypothetical protein